MGAAPEALAISGRVYDRGDVPLPGAKIRIQLRTPPGTRNFSLARTFDEALEADDEGRFRVEVPGGGVYRVTAETPGFAAARQDGVLPGHTIEFHLPAGARLTGVVLRESDRQPIEGVEVQLSGPNYRAATTAACCTTRCPTATGARASP